MFGEQVAARASPPDKPARPLAQYVDPFAIAPLPLSSLIVADASIKYAPDGDEEASCADLVVPSQQQSGLLLLSHRSLIDELIRVRFAGRVRIRARGVRR